LFQPETFDKLSGSQPCQKSSVKEVSQSKSAAARNGNVGKLKQGASGKQFNRLK
jgi:hypothetical protein